MAETPITIREIVSEAINSVDDPSNTVAYDEQIEQCIQKIKQKMAHLRRVMYQELEHKKLMQPREQVPGSQTMSLQTPLLTDEILDIVYNELDNALEGLDQEKKDLAEMSRNEN